MKNLKHIDFPIFSTGEMMRISVRRTLAQVASPFQEILVVDAEDHGKCLILDNEMQCAESDHDLYDSEMLKLLRNEDETLLILGGGDGYVAQKAIAQNEKLSIIIADLDIQVINVSRELLGQKIFDHPRVTVCVEDALEYLQDALTIIHGKYDGIVCDLTDSPIGRKEFQDFMLFYEELVQLSYENLTANGWISIQAGASDTNNHHINAGSILQELLASQYAEVFKSDMFIPSYGEQCAFLHARKQSMARDKGTPKWKK